MLTLSGADLQALVEGETVVAFLPRGEVTESDEVDLAAEGAGDPSALKPAYRRWASVKPPRGPWSAVVVLVAPVAILDPEAGSSRHIFEETPQDGDLVVLRVYGKRRAVLSDEAFAARRKSVEGALRE